MQTNMVFVRQFSAHSERFHGAGSCRVTISGTLSYLPDNLDFPT
jgi:hypothetical protein